MVTDFVNASVVDAIKKVELRVKKKGFRPEASWKSSEEANYAYWDYMDRDDLKVKTLADQGILPGSKPRRISLPTGRPLNRLTSHGIAHASGLSEGPASEAGSEAL